MFDICYTQNYLVKHNYNLGRDPSVNYGTISGIVFDSVLI